MDSTLRRVAVIDCGTNTFNLRIVEFLKDVDPGFRPWKKLFSLRLPVRIGEGGIGKGIIKPDGIARGLDAIGMMKEAIHNYVTEEVYVIATSALRDASNSSDFKFQLSQTAQLPGKCVRFIDDNIAPHSRYITEDYNTRLYSRQLDIGGSAYDRIITIPSHNTQGQH